MRYKDPLGLWSTEVHNHMIDQAFPDLSNALKNAIKQGSASIDNLAGQFGDSFPHAMRDRGQSIADARAKYCNFIQDNLRDYFANRGSASGALRRGAHRALGMALHAVMDSTSPAHRGFQEWSTSNPWNHGDLTYSMENMQALELNPALLAETVNLMNQAVSGTNPCPCGQY